MPKLPGINHQHAVRALEKAGFRIIRQGKHIVMSDGVRILTIPRHNPINAITMGGIVRDDARNTAYGNIRPRVRRHYGSVFTLVHKRLPSWCARDSARCL